MTFLIQKEFVKIQSDSGESEGILALPTNASGLVLFAHGSGSSRLSPRNNYIASEFQHAQMGTLLIDLLTRQENQDYKARFDISLLTQRLHAALHWLQQYNSTKFLPIGLFGASTGAAASLQLASMPENNIAAIVAHGGRPDLSGRHALEKVHAPTLLIVAKFDDVLIKLNQLAYTTLQCEKQLEIIPGATHLFEKQSTLKVVSALAINWFERYLTKSTPAHRNIRQHEDAQSGSSNAPNHLSH